MDTHRNDLWGYIASLGVKHYAWNDPFFEEGNKKCKFLQKVPCIDIDDESLLHEDYGTIRCSTQGCRETFATVAEHAAHQRSRHGSNCVTCGMAFPTSHLLDLHINEIHSSLFKVMAEKQPMFKCLLETCSEIFENPAIRKEHCMTVHKFPANFRYDISWRKIKKSSPSDMECEDQKSLECDASKASSSFSLRKPKLVPTTFTFGSGVPRGFQRGHKNRGHRGKGKNPHLPRDQDDKSKSKINIEEVNMKELEKALPEDSNVMETL
ncbi:hypothetical protein SK128_015445 [Halocaridina rubra]|uniref:C2H2-type domain-containing protein n=1 Tax=Halocaridina rubra TaxID=373956 RepID=A0AAN8WHL9_HALRR